MAEKIQITIVGLGFVGASAGLALRRHQDKVVVVGHDRDFRLAEKAKRLGACERVERNLIDAVSSADRILLALPVAEIRDTLSAIAGELKPGCLLVDTAEVKAPVMQWAAELLPDTVHLVGGHPILVAADPSPENATADTFENAFFCLTPSARTDDTAVRLAADLVEAMGARPLFMDAMEHDGMAAIVEQVPEIVAGAMMQAAAGSASWRDIRKLTAGPFYRSTLMTSPSASAAAGACIANREHVLRWLDTLIGALGDWQQRLAGSDETGLTQEFERGMTARQDWLRAHETGRWEDEVDLPPFPTTGDVLRSMVGFSKPPGAELDKKR